MQPVAVRILHPSSSPTAGELERALEASRRANAERAATLFRASGAGDVRIETGPDRRPFGDRLRRLVRGVPGGGGLVVLGSGSIPLATRRDVRDLLAVAGSGERRALANNRFSADVVAVGVAATLASMPDLQGDNELPRWLAERAGFMVDDLRRRWRLSVDIDSPLDAFLVDRLQPAGGDLAAVAARAGRIRALADDPRAELLVAGRTSGATLRWLERHTASRTRALVEERGLRASGPGGRTPAAAPVPRGAPLAGQRPPRSVLGLVLESRGPDALGLVLAELGDAALVDTRVLLAHRLGADETAWPPAEDRFASDLLLAERIRDPWLRALTTAARDAPIPVLLGGHTLVGPGVRLLVGRRR